MKKYRIVVSGVVAIALSGSMVLVGCSSDDSNKDASGSKSEETTPEKTQESESKFLKAAEERGEPKLSTAEVPTELKITDDVEGTGKEVAAGATVTVHYTGAAASTAAVFDSSWSRGEPITFPLDGVIEGWSKGLVGMKEGGRRTLVIPAALAYGNGGPAPGDALVFVVDLIAVENG